MSTTFTYAVEEEETQEHGDNRSRPYITINAPTDPLNRTSGDSSQLPEFQLSTLQEQDVTHTSSTPHSSSHAPSHFNFGPRAPRISRIRQSYPARSPLPPALLPAHVTQRRSEANLQTLRSIRPSQTVDEPVSRISVMDLPDSFSRTREPISPPNESASNPTHQSGRTPQTDHSVGHISAPAAITAQSLTPDMARLTGHTPRSREFSSHSVHLSDAPQSTPLDDVGFNQQSDPQRPQYPGGYVPSHYPAGFQPQPGHQPPHYTTFYQTQNTHPPGTWSSYPTNQPNPEPPTTEPPRISQSRPTTAFQGTHLHSPRRSTSTRRPLPTVPQSEPALRSRGHTPLRASYQNTPPGSPYLIAPAPSPRNHQPDQYPDHPVYPTLSNTPHPYPTGGRPYWTGTEWMQAGEPYTSAPYGAPTYNGPHYTNFPQGTFTYGAQPYNGPFYGAPAYWGPLPAGTTYGGPRYGGPPQGGPPDGGPPYGGPPHGEPPHGGQPPAQPPQGGPPGGPPPGGPPRGPSPPPRRPHHRHPTTPPPSSASFTTPRHSPHPARIRLPTLEMFDGQDPRQVRTFISQMIQAFDLDGDAFPDDRRQVSYATIHLKGDARIWWEGISSQIPEHAMRSDWALFVTSLNERFGDPFTQQTAAQNISIIRMQKDNQVSPFLLDFEKWAYDTQFNDAALRHAFINGLPYRLRNALAHRDRPTTFSELKRLVISLDYNYWDLQAFNRPTPYVSNVLARNTIPDTRQRPSTNSTNNTTSGSRQRPSTNSNNTNPTPTGYRPPPANTNPTPSGSRPLVPTAERARRRQDNLCLNCGQPGHQARTCNNPTKTGRLAFTLTTDNTDNIDEPTSPTPDSPPDEEEPDPDEGLYTSNEDSQGND